MMKLQLKNLIFILLLMVINTIISFSITYIFGIQNIVIFKTLSFICDSITYEILIFIALSIMEGIIYEIKKKC